MNPSERPKVSVFMGLSLDGYIAGENGDLSWLTEIAPDPPEQTGYTAFFDDIDVLVLGRNTYDIVLPFETWPYVGKKVVVLTHRPLEPQHGETAYEGSLPDLLRRLRHEGFRHVYLDGGETVRQGLRLNVVDELTLSWLPVILGKGIPLFTEELPRLHWRLEETRTLPSGLLQGKYVRA